MSGFGFCRAIAFAAFLYPPLALLADTITVTNAGDSGAGTLRQAIADAAIDDTIDFDSGLNGSTITLSGGDLVLSNDVSILGPGPDQLAVSGNASSRVFSIHLPETGDRYFSISGLTLTNGFSDSNGGAIYGRSRAAGNDWDFRAHLTISNCVITGSSCATDGGGIYASRYTSLTIVDCTVAGNAASNDGGGLSSSYGLTIDRCAFSGNAATNSGGAIHCNEHEVTVIKNSTVSGNNSLYGGWNDIYGGGGIYFRNLDTNAYVYNCTVVSNVANKNGGGFYLHSGTTPWIYSTIIAGNTDGGSSNDVYGSFTNVDHCLIQYPDGAPIHGGNNITNQSPLLGPLADNGGPTLTHAPANDSPAKDAGSNPLSLLYDQRGPGFDREMEAAPDIGAFESPPPAGAIIFVR